MSGPLPSWPVFSPTQSHFRGTLLRTIAPEVTRPTHLQRYPAQFRFPSSSPCHPRLAGPHLYPSFPTLRLGLLDFPSPMNSVLIPIYFVFLDLSSFPLTPLPLIVVTHLPCRLHFLAIVVTCLYLWESGSSCLPYLFELVLSPGPSFVRASFEWMSKMRETALIEGHPPDENGAYLKYGG
jgi:hypothetical protein